MSAVDVVAFGAHPDDVELGCGGTLAKLSAAGRRVAIVHLTRGERGTRGTEAERIAEAERAGAALGAVAVEFLDCGDGAFRTGEAEEDQVIGVLRRLRPELVFGPSPHDRHPDHGRGHRLVEAACYYAGLRRRGAGEPHRPGAFFAFMQHDPFDPAFIVDVTAFWPKKLAALAEYHSQLHQAGQAERAEPATKIAAPEFVRAIEGRARHFGLLSGGEFGEPFWSRTPPAVSDPWTLVPAGIR